MSSRLLVARFGFVLSGLTLLGACSKSSSSGGTGGAATGGSATGGAATGGAAAGGQGGARGGGAGGEGQPATGGRANTGGATGGGSGAAGAKGGAGGAKGRAGGSAGAGGASSVGGAAGSSGDGGVVLPLVPAFVDAAKAYAAVYQSWGRVDDELRWAPWLCRIPYPGITRPSTSQDENTHGQKLYSVFAKNHDAYPAGDSTGQVVVKQSWIPEVVTEADAGFAPGSVHFAQDAGDHFYGYAKGDGGVVYRASALAGLYFMFKLEPGTPDTDEGWVYATMTAAGEVTAAGRISSCMSCHEMATHGRLFGVPLSPSQP